MCQRMAPSLVSTGLKQTASQHHMTTQKQEIDFDEVKY